MLQPYLAIGQVVKPQGVRGEVKVKPLTDDPRRFLDLTQVLMRDGEAYQPRAIGCTRVHDGFAYLQFEGAQDREAAEALRGMLLFVDRANAVPLDEDTNYIVDLVGCEVFDTQQKPIGTLAEVLQPGANDVYVIHTPKGELMIPALKRVVPVVDVAARRIVIDEGVLPEVAVYNTK